MNPNNERNQPNPKAHGQSDVHVWSRTSPEPTLQQRDTASHIVRQQIDHQYTHNPPNQLKQQEPNPYQQTHQPTVDWQQYHTAWQSYYQQYYERYYAQQLASQQPQPDQQIVSGADNLNLEPLAPRSRTRQLKDDLLRTVRERAGKARQSRHFMPIMSALIVGLIFLFLQFNRVMAAQVEAYISPGSTVDSSDSIIIDPAANASVGAEPRIIIPKINVSAPVIYDVTTVEDRVVQAALERGVVHYNLPGANSVPGQNGNTVILGHSSNDVFDPGSYKFAFVLIDRLQPGDLFYLNYQGKRYVYKVTEKKTIKPEDWRVLQTSGKPTATLVTCTPIGTAINRLLVTGEQISPDPSTASTQTSPSTKTTAPSGITGNSPTFFERLRDIFF